MADENAQSKGSQAGESKNVDEVALEMMKFIALTTGYGKPQSAGPGFAAKPGRSSGEEYAESLMTLFEKCRAVVKKS